MVAEGMIDRRDLSLALVTDNLDEAMRHIQQRTAEQFGLSLATAAARQQKFGIRNLQFGIREQNSKS